MWRWGDWRRTDAAAPPTDADTDADNNNSNSNKCHVHSTAGCPCPCPLDALPRLPMLLHVPVEPCGWASPSRTSARAPRTVQPTHLESAHNYHIIHTKTKKGAFGGSSDLCVTSTWRHATSMMHTEHALPAAALGVGHHVRDTRRKYGFAGDVKHDPTNEHFRTSLLHSRRSVIQSQPPS